MPAEQVRSAVQQRLLLEASAEPARLRTRVEQSLRAFFSGPRDNVLSIRVDNSDVAAIDSLVEAGVLKTRSEAAAWLIKSGIEANRSLFEQVQAKDGRDSALARGGAGADPPLRRGCSLGVGGITGASRRTGGGRAAAARPAVVRWRRAARPPLHHVERGSAAGAPSFPRRQEARG